MENKALKIVIPRGNKIKKGKDHKTLKVNLSIYPLSIIKIKLLMFRSHLHLLIVKLRIIKLLQKMSKSITFLTFQIRTIKKVRYREQ